MAERSSNYPAYPLARAVEWTKALYKSDRRNSVPIDTVAKATGSEAEKGISGPARQKVATMKQYGLIDSTAHGQYRISEIGFDLALHQTQDPEYQDALKRAALTPPLFSEIYHRYPELPSDHTLRIGLIKGQFGGAFSDQAARRFIKAFKETISFANLDRERYNDSDDERKGDSVNDEHETELQRFTNWKAKLQGRGDAVPPISLVLPPGVTAQVTFSGNRPTRRTIEKLVAHLNLMADDFDDPSGSSQAEPERLRDLESGEDVAY